MPGACDADAELCHGQGVAGPGATVQASAAAAENLRRPPRVAAYAALFSWSSWPAMMYFSKLKTAVVIGVCVLGVLLCIPNIVPAPVGWLPWRQVHLGLDLRGGSYLLLEVDMAAVAKERLTAMADGVRTTLRGKVQFQPPTVQPAQNRVTVRLIEPGAADRRRAAAAGPPPIPATADRRNTTSTSTTPGEITLTLSTQALRDRANSAVQQSIEIVRRRIDETGVLDPQITRQGDDRIVVQLPGVEDPNRIKELIGKTAKMTFRLVDENANLSRAAAARRRLPADARTSRASRCRSAAGSRWTART